MQTFEKRCRRLSNCITHGSDRRRALCYHSCMHIFDSISRFFESTYRDDKVVLSTVCISIAVNLFSWVALYIQLRPFSYLAESGQIPLHYSLNFGVDAIGPWYAVFVMPALGLAILVFNSALGYLFYYKEKVLSYMLLITQCVINIILAVGGYFTILLNS